MIKTESKHMKIFLDTASIKSIQKLLTTGLIDGVTTNPTHLSKEQGVPTEVVKQICTLLPNGEISVEVTEKDPESVYIQAKKIAALAKNIVVKIPCHPDYFEVIGRLVQESIPLNITLLFSTFQGLAMAKLGAKYVSPFVGRLDDIDVDGMQLVRDLRFVFDEYDYVATKVLAASIRSVQHVHEALLAGTDAITMSPEVFEKAINHPLTNAGMQKFDDDWQKLGIRQFP
jgi:transaldolase